MSVALPFRSGPEIATGTPRVRLAALADHCVFYQAPLYRALARDPRVDLTVYFLDGRGTAPYDAGFGARRVAWDGDLLGGYDSRFPDGGVGALRELARADFDVLWVHGFTNPVLALAIAAARLRGKPVLLREEQTLLRRRRAPKRWLRAAALRALFTQVHALAIGSSNGDYFRHHGVPAARLHSAPYCVDNDALRAEASALAPRRAALQRRFGLAPSQPVVLFVGKLAPVKRPLELLDAFARVRAEHRCSLLVVGEGELEPVLRAKAERIPDVTFAGFLNRGEIACAYAAADILACPSLHETFALVVPEAMNFGLPVVTTATVGCNADLVHPGENGFVVPPDDVGALADALGALVADDVLRRRLGARSLELVEPRTYERTRDGIVDACLRAVGSGT